MRRLMLIVAIATLVTPALAEEFSLKKSVIASPSVLIPFSAKESFGQPMLPPTDAFPGERRDQTVEFELRSNASASGVVPGVTLTATRSAFPSPGPLFQR